MSFVSFRPSCACGCGRVCAGNPSGGYFSYSGHCGYNDANRSNIYAGAVSNPVIIQQQPVYQQPTVVIMGQPAGVIMGQPGRLPTFGMVYRR